MGVTRDYIYEVRKEIEELMLENEYNTITYKGVPNVSNSDLGEIKMRLGAILTGTSRFIEPVGTVREVLIAISKGK